MKNNEKSFWKKVTTLGAGALMGALPMNAEALEKIPAVPGNEGNKITVDMNANTVNLDYENEEKTPDMGSGGEPPIKKVGAESKTGNPLQPVLPYGTHTLEEVRDSLLNGTSPKAKEMKRLVLKNIKELLSGYEINDNPETLKWIYNHLSFVEVQLKPGEWKNSGWDPKTNKIVEVEGKDFDGMVIYFTWTDPESGITFETALAKANCVNILNSKKIKTGGEKVEKKEPAYEKLTGVCSNGKYVLNVDDNFRVNKKFVDENGDWHYAGRYVIRFYSGSPYSGLPHFAQGWVEDYYTGKHYQINQNEPVGDRQQEGQPLVNE